MKIVEYVPVESKAASFHKVPHEDYTNHLVKQKALIASEIETTSPSLLIQTLQGKKKNYETYNRSARVLFLNKYLSSNIKQV